MLWHTIGVAIFGIRFIADDIWQVIRLTRGLLVGHVHAVVHFVFGEVKLFMRQFVTFIILVMIIRGLVGFTEVPLKLPVSFPFAKIDSKQSNAHRSWLLVSKIVNAEANYAEGEPGETYDISTLPLNICGKISCIFSALEKNEKGGPWLL